MSVSMGQPAPIAGDIKLVYSNTGTAGSGGSATIAIDSYSLPALSAGEFYLIYTEWNRATGTQNLSAGITATSGNLLSNPAGWVNSSSTGQAANLTWIFNSQETAGSATLIQQGTPTTNAVFQDTDLGDLGTEHTIYLNYLRQTTSTYKYRWSIYKIGSNVK